MFNRWEGENDSSVGNLKGIRQEQLLRLPIVFKTIQRIEQGRNKTNILTEAINIYKQLLKLSNFSHFKSACYGSISRPFCNLFYGILQKGSLI